MELKDLPSHQENVGTFLGGLSTSLTPLDRTTLVVA